MTPLFTRKLIIICITLCLACASNAQPVSADESEMVKVNKPYKILTSGKQITVKGAKEIKTVIVWTASGHRIVEEKSINSSTFSFNINVAEKAFFIMIQFEGSKPYTEKIGVQ